ncbi:MAG: hypothetical protein ACI9K8_001654, partial [Reinekea sp.]
SIATHMAMLCRYQGNNGALAIELGRYQRF